MNIFNILLLTCILFTVFMGIIVYRRNSKHPVNQIYTVLSMLVAYSGVVNYFISIAGSETEVYALLRLTSLRLFIFPVSVHFYLLLTQQKHVFKGYLLYILLYLFPSMMVFTTNPRDLFDVVLINKTLGWNFYMKDTVIDNAMTIYILSLTFLLIFLGINYIIRSKDKLHKVQGLLVLTGLIGALIFPVVFDIALPLFNIVIPQISSLAFILGYCLIAFAIIRFELFAATPASAADEILKNISDAVILTDRLGNITFVNESAVGLFGFDKEELLGKNIQELFAGDIPGEITREGPETMNETIISNSGFIAVMVSHTALYLHKDELNGHAYIIREITELKNLIDKLAESETRYKNIFENIQSVYFESSPDGTILEISPSVSDYTDYKREDLIGQSITKLYSGNLPPEEYWELFMKSQGMVIVSVQMNGKTGMTGEGMLHTRLLRKPDGTPDRLVGSVTSISALKKAEKQLAESEERYRLLFEKSPEGILVVKGFDEGIAANEAAMQILGVQTVKECLDHPLIGFVHPDDKEMLIHFNQNRINRRKEKNQGVVRIIRPDGAVRNIDYLIHEISFGEEKFLQIMMHDITEKVEAQKRLIDSEKRYSLLVETSPDSISLMNDKFEILMVNSQTALYTGIPVEKMVGTNIFDYLPNPEATGEREKVIQQVFDKGEILEQVRVIWDTAVGRKWFSVSIVPLKDENNKVEMVMGIIRDITQIEEAEQKIRRNEAIYRLFLENFQGIAFRLSFENRLEFLYGEVFELTGYTIEDFFAGIPDVRRIIYPEDRLNIFKALRMLRQIPNSRVTIECRIIHRNGSIKYLRLYLQNMMDEKGKPSFLQAALFDKTDYYDLQNKIINSVIETEDRERRRFAEDLHDELGPLLSSVRIYINLIQTKNPGQEKERLELIEIAKQLLDDAIGQTKSISYNLMPEVLNQYGFIPSIKSYCRKTNIADKLNVVIQTDDIDEEARFDAKVEIALYRVVKELIYNTVKHSGAKNIRIRFFMHHQMPALEYSDDGQGFNVDQKVQSGTTLGVRNIFHRIQSVNGTVNFNSAPDKGIKVTIKW